MKFIKHIIIFFFLTNYFYGQMPILISGYSSFSTDKSSIPFISYKLTSSNLIEDKITQIKKYQLHQNYPNPFNPSTTIKYSLSEQIFVTIKVYDLLGKEISTLVNQIMTSGTHEIIFDSNAFDGGLPGGMYFVKMTVGSFTEVRKIILLK
ncbi:MAG: T9SS type A sorting domain-containing protein [Ignavibacteriales bacterium]|nr:T9SS type A sorting domain-containing protein [Ignavibacteriales bacterium]